MHHQKLFWLRSAVQIVLWCSSTGLNHYLLVCFHSIAAVVGAAFDACWVEFAAGAAGTSGGWLRAAETFLHSIQQLQASDAAPPLSRLRSVLQERERVSQFRLSFSSKMHNQVKREDAKMGAAQWRCPNCLRLPYPTQKPQSEFYECSEWIWKMEADEVLHGKGFVRQTVHTPWLDRFLVSSKSWINKSVAC